MYQSSQPTPRLIRSRQDRMIAGVAGGIAQYLAIDPVIVRLGFVALIFTGLGIFLYPVLWLIMPEEGSSRATLDQAFDQMRHEVEQVGSDVWQTIHPTDRSARSDADQATEFEVPLQDMGASPQIHAESPRTRQLGIILIGVGALFLLSMILGPMFGKLLFPLVLIGAGLFFLQRKA